MYDLVQKVISEQAPSGAFCATVMHQGRPFQDENTLVTSLVLSELDKVQGDAELQGVIRRGLSFLENVVGDEARQAYHLYPQGCESKPLHKSAIRRADDLALSTMTLVRHHLMDESEALRIAAELEVCRLNVKPVGSLPWVEPGAYKTWVDATLCPNRVDCVVNANVAAFFSFLGLQRTDGYRAAVHTVCQGVEMALQTPSYTSQLTPYHPDPSELGHAMERAVALGVHEFEELLDDVWNRLKPLRQKAGLLPFCGSGDRQTLWFSPCLQMARNLSRHHAPVEAFSA